MIVLAIIILVFSIGYLLYNAVLTSRQSANQIVITVSPSTVPFSEKTTRSPIPSPATTTAPTSTTVIEIDPNAKYITVTDSCGYNFSGECVRVRSGPGTNYPIVNRLRDGMVLRTDGIATGDGLTWYKVIFDEWLRYPARVKGDWYVAAAYVATVAEPAETAVTPLVASSSKKIIVDRSEQKLYAYDDDTIFMETLISTGLELSPTPRGTFTIFKKLPSRYMQGPLPYLAVSKYYDLPGVPWNLYFNEQGAVIHGTYWHNSFGRPYSSGCVNMRPEEAEQLYRWAEIGTKVIIRD